MEQLGGRVMPRPAHVPPGRWATQIVFWSPVTKTVRNDQGDVQDDPVLPVPFGHSRRTTG